MDMYILDANGKPVLEPDLIQWSQAFHDSDRRVARTDITAEVYVSTVFLGMDHQNTPGGPPLIFESMVFRNGEGTECERYTTRGQAIAGHEAICANLREQTEKQPTP
jgi:hypothetical protein